MTEPRRFRTLRAAPIGRRLLFQRTFATILFSFILLKEKIRPVPLAAVICAFLGSLFVIKPALDFSKMIPTLAGFVGYAIIILMALVNFVYNAKKS